MRGKFIVIEGGDGAGKDANIELLKRDFPSENIVWVRDPGGTEISDRIREITQHGQHLSREAELFLFLASRAQLVNEVILPALESGKHVISNRFDLSTVAYQIYGRERLFMKDALLSMSKVARGDATPDLMVLLDVPPEEGLIRAAQRKEKTTRFEAEALAFHARVHEGYRAHVGDYPLHRIIDASRPLAEVYLDVQAAVGNVLS